MGAPRCALQECPIEKAIFASQNRILLHRILPQRYAADACDILCENFHYPLFYLTRRRAFESAVLVMQTLPTRADRCPTASCAASR